MVSLRTIVASVLTCFAAVSLASSHSVTVETANIEMANHAVLSALVVESSEKGRYLCTEAPLACLGSNGGELGLALLTNIRSSASDKALADLLRFRLDGALEETYGCSLASRSGTRLVADFHQIKPNALRKQCLGEVDKFLRHAKAYTGDLNVDAVCLLPDEIVKKRNELVRTVGSKLTCD